MALSPVQRLQLEKDVEDEAVADLKALQLQPALYGPYRRFVIVTEGVAPYTVGSHTTPQAVEFAVVDDFSKTFSLAT